MSDEKPKPLPPGSMGRTRRVMDELNKAANKGNADKPADEKPETEEASEEEEQPKPKAYMTAHGELTEEQFKEHFKDVFEEVAEGKLFSIGFVEHKTKAFGMNIKVRTLLDREREAVIEPLSTTFNNDPLGSEGAQALSQMIRMQCVLCVMELGDNKLNPLKIRLTSANADKWREDDEVQGRINFYEDKSRAILERLAAIIQDAHQALELAVQESMGNH